MSYTSLSRAALCAVILVVSACGSDDEPPGQSDASSATDTSDDTGPSASNTIGAAGGTLNGPNGVVIEVPAGAVGSDTEFTVNQAFIGVTPSNGASFVAPILDIGTDGTQFDTPITVSIPYDGSDDALAALISDDGEHWTPLTYTLSGGKMNVSVPHLSYVSTTKGCAAAGFGCEVFADC